MESAARKPNATAYEDQRHEQWTRIDLLIALFDAGIRRIEEASQALQSDDQLPAKRALLLAQRIVLELKLGLRLQGGEMTQRADQLYDYVLRCLQSATADELASSTRVLKTLREGFVGIRDEAVQLERQGVLPATTVQNTLEVRL